MLIFISVGLFSSMAALPPKARNQRDLDVMLQYLNENPDALATLESIDIKEKVIYYGRGKCKAIFKRKKRITPPGWVGPRAPLVFKETICIENE